MRVQNLFGMEISDFKKKLIIKNILCITYFILTITLNIILTILRNEANHNLLLLLNIILDILCFFTLLTYIGCYFKPKLNILKLYNDKRIVVEGEITEISSNTHRYMNLDCFVVVINAHKYYLPRNKFLQLCVGETIKVSTAYEVILEVITDEV